MLVKLLREFLALRPNTAFNAEQAARMLRANRKVSAEPEAKDMRAAFRKLRDLGHVTVLVDADTKEEHYQATPLGIAAYEAAP